MKQSTLITIIFLLFFAVSTKAITLNELKKYQAEIKKACFPEECEDWNENQMVQPSNYEIEEKLGVKGLCRMGGIDEDGNDIWWIGDEKRPNEVAYFGAMECTYTVLLDQGKKIQEVHFTNHNGQGKIGNSTAILFVYFVCHEGSCHTNTIEIFLKR